MDECRDLVTFEREAASHKNGRNDLDMVEKLELYRITDSLARKDTIEGILEATYNFQVLAEVVTSTKKIIIRTESSMPIAKTSIHVVEDVDAKMMDEV